MVGSNPIEIALNNHMTDKKCQRENELKTLYWGS